MSFKYFLFLISATLFLKVSFAQQHADTLVHKLDNLSKKTGSAGYQINNTKESAYNNTTMLSGRDYLVLLGSNIKQSFTKPFHMTGRDWKQFGIFTGVALAAGFADEPIQTGVLKWRTSSSAVRNTGNYISRFGGVYEMYMLAGFGAYGLAFKNDKIKNTTLLAIQAYITSGLAETVLKTLTGRIRPDYYGQYTEAEPKFTGPFGKDVTGKKSNSSFPSGHATVAFAVATVFAKEYANQPLVPVIAYSAATLIGVSRITENKHWTTDVLVGAALGYVTGRQVVNNYHRFAENKMDVKKKGQLTFNLNYSFGRLMPGIAYKF